MTITGVLTAVINGRYRVAKRIPGGYPLVEPNPDGIGLVQVEGTQHTISDGTYWSYLTNIGDAEGILTADKTTGYNFWTKQLADAGYPPLNPPPLSQNLTYCKFALSPGSGQHPWSDAEWITVYNGTGGTKIYPLGYYLVWTGTNSSNGVWKYNVSSTGRSYVGDVCKSQPY